MRKNLFNISDLSKEELKFVLSTEIVPNSLKSKNIGLIFEKPSTRTRISFSTGIFKLGGNSIDIKFDELNISRDESFEDTFRALNCYLDCIIYRTSDHTKLTKSSKYFKKPMINALSDISHPCQIISDLLTLKDIFGELNIKICWFGDVNNVLYSLIEAANLIEEIELFIFTPEYCEKKISLIINKNIKIFNKIDLDILKKCDCVMTDVFISMNDNIDNEKINSLMQYQVNQKVMEVTKNECVFMHCLPAKPGMEVTKDVLYGKKSIIWTQAKNRMIAQQKLLQCLDI